MATLNVAMKVNRAIGGATTVNANCVAIVTYTAGGYSGPGGNNGSSGLGGNQTVCIRTFGPGQSVPASFGGSYPASYNGNPGTIQGTISFTWTLASGVELINTQ